MYYLQSRYYDPQLGRFVNADEIAMAIIFAQAKDILGEVNLYAYCSNSPIDCSDRFGYKKKRMSVKQTLVFGIIGLVVNLVKHGANIFRIFQCASITMVERTILSIVFLLPTKLATELVKYYVKNLAATIVAFSSTIIYELLMLGLNVGKLSVAGMIINAVCTLALMYLPKLVDSINMIFYGLKNKCYYWDVKWYGIKYYS
jgi:RHS repeat-associated protein